MQTIPDHKTFKGRGVKRQLGITIPLLLNKNVTTMWQTLNNTGLKFHTCLIV